MILGLDISTSCTGWSIFEESGQFVEMGAIDLKKETGLFDKASKVKKSLHDIFIKYLITDVCIEENLQAFRPGFSSAKTLLTLARFNGVISYICKEIFERDPSFINVNVARRAIGLKVIRKSKGGKPTKEQVLDWVCSDIDDPSYMWPSKVLKSGPRKGQKVLEATCYDMADAYVIGSSFLILKNQHV